MLETKRAAPKEGDQTDKEGDTLVGPGLSPEILFPEPEDSRTQTCVKPGKERRDWHHPALV